MIKYYSFRKIRQMYSDMKKLRNKKIVEEILSNPVEPRFCDNEGTLDKLLKMYNPLPEYGYDNFSTWQRGVQRAQYVIQTFMLKDMGAKVLDACCGDGMFGYSMSTYGHKVTLLDMNDWRDNRAKNIQFQKIDISFDKIDASDGEYDLVCSFNAFEHIENPSAAIEEIVRVCKPGGAIYLDFGPIYPGPFGLHAYRAFPVPYIQYLFSAIFINNIIDNTGIYDLGSMRQKLQYTNKLKSTDYLHIFNNCNCDIIDIEYVHDIKWLQLIKTYPKCFSGYNLTFEDVTIQALRVIMKKHLTTN